MVNMINNAWNRIHRAMGQEMGGVISWEGRRYPFIVLEGGPYRDAAI